MKLSNICPSFNDKAHQALKWVQANRKKTIGISAFVLGGGALFAGAGDPVLSILGGAFAASVGVAAEVLDRRGKPDNLPPPSL